MKRAIFLFLGILVITTCSQTDRASRLLSDEFELTWEFRGNNPEHGISSAVFTLKNISNQVLGDDNWMLYFNQMGMGVVDASVTGNVRIEHLNGDLLRISPLDGFELGPGQLVEISYSKPGSIIKRTEAPSGPYIVFGRTDDPDRRTGAIKNYSVKPYPHLEKIFPAGSGIPLPDAAWIFEQNIHQRRMDPLKMGKIVPTPVQANYTGETIVISNKVKIHYKPGLETEVERLKEGLNTLLGFTPPAAASTVKGKNIILLSTIESTESFPDEGYELEVNANEGITIQGGSAAGVYYGIRSLLALVPVEAWRSPVKSFEIECTAIMDYPAFEYRGIMLDLARNYNRPEAIMKLIDAMAMYKMNKLHLHLTDDEAWRIEISSLPELTDVGGFRGHTLNSKDYLIPTYGSGPYPDPESGAGSGFLSRRAFIEILRYARDHHVEVIPEINFPGHARAAIHAMEFRYDRLMMEGKIAEAEKYRLIDPDDRSVYNSAQNFNDNVICVCQESPFLFFESVVDEVINMYRDAGLELKTIHVGGDEVPGGSWSGSPICKAFIEAHPEVGEAADLQVYFEGRLLEILSRKNLVMAGWEEIALKKDTKARGGWTPNDDFVGKGMLPYVWNSLDETLDLGNRVANAGFPVVLCNVDNFYLDLAYTHHPDEPGHYWGGFVNARRGFEFIPFHVFHSTITNKYRIPYGPEKRFDGFEPLHPESRKNILGIQGQLWSEHIKGSDLLEYAYLPKMLGLVERAWTGQPDWGMIEEKGARVEAINQAWDEFANVIGHRELPRLDHLSGGYNYRLPPPGAVFREGMLLANVDFPGLTIRYSTDGTDPTMESPVYREPLKVSGPVRLATFDTRGRKSRISVAEIR